MTNQEATLVRMCCQLFTFGVRAIVAAILVDKTSSHRLGIPRDHLDIMSSQMNAIHDEARPS